MPVAALAERPAQPDVAAQHVDFRLTDGGDYDNMGLEPVWKSHAVVLVSDAGGLFTQESDKGLLWRIPRYQSIQERQARALRKRWLIASFNQGTLDGTYWSVASAPSQYEEEGGKEEGEKEKVGTFPGYSKDLARTVIAEIRTRPRRLLRRGGGGAGQPRLSGRRGDPPTCAGGKDRSRSGVRGGAS